MKTKFFQIIGIIVVVSIALTNVNLSYNNTPKASDIELTMLTNSALANNTEGANSGTGQNFWQKLMGLFSGGGSVTVTKINSTTTEARFYTAEGDSAIVRQETGGGFTITATIGNETPKTDSIPTGASSLDELYKSMGGMFNK